MGRRKGSDGGTKVKKRKKVTVRVIKEKHAGETTEPHRILQDILRKHHGHLDGVKIGLAWRSGWRSDADGHMKIGQCRKSSDLDREMYSGFDFVILLNEEAWPRLNEKQKLAVIDHELCHAALSMDANGEPKYNDRDRLCCRIKKHDVEEFRCIVERHGLYTQDLVDVVKAAISDAKRPLLAEAEKAAPEPSSTTEGNGSEAAPSKAWRRWNLQQLTNLGLPDGKRKLLEEAGLDTMGKLMDSLAKAEEPDFWYKTVKGLGEGGYDALTEAITKLRAARLEFQADVAQD